MDSGIKSTATNGAYSSNCYYCNALQSEERVKRLNSSILGICWMKRVTEPVLFYQDSYAYSLSIDRTDKSF